MTDPTDCSHEGLISLDEALISYSTHIQPLDTLILSLPDAHQHVLAADVYSAVALPLFSQSAVDGYALRAADCHQAGSRLLLAGEIRAGVQPPLPLQAGQAIRIFTGGKLPEGADTVARQEIVQRELPQADSLQPHSLQTTSVPTESAADNASHIIIQHALTVGTDIRYEGEELAKNTLLATQGQTLHAGLIAALSMAGIQHVQVYRQPTIAVLITGDEISSQPTHDAQVFDANGPLIQSWLKQCGFASIMLQHVVDEREALSSALSRALNQFDLVITTGGVSVGDYDLIRPVSMALGAQQIFWQVAQKPGKPLYFASFAAHQTAQQPDSGSSFDSSPSNITRPTSYLIGLPGNPAAVVIGLHIHVQTILNQLQGKQPALPEWQSGIFDGQLKADSRERLLRMKMQINQHGCVHLHSLNKQQSHMLSNLAQANALVRIPAHSTINSGDLLSFLRMD
ncbi:MAG: molybdopterin molybdenumtransferase MoeA [Moraxellaceae bacterium]|nr:MAG: molybdopterin molybdenumtransferase MoeA [Moraxellaceae bacterium]